MYYISAEGIKDAIIDGFCPMITIIKGPGVPAMKSGAGRNGDEVTRYYIWNPDEEDEDEIVEYDEPVAGYVVNNLGGSEFMEYANRIDDFPMPFVMNANFEKPADKVAITMITFPTLYEYTFSACSWTESGKREIDEVYPVCILNRIGKATNIPQGALLPLYSKTFSGAQHFSDHCNWEMSRFLNDYDSNMAVVTFTVPNSMLEEKDRCWPFEGYAGD